jgi:hypothetical protein
MISHVGVQIICSLALKLDNMHYAHHHGYSIIINNQKTLTIYKNRVMHKHISPIQYIFHA